MSDWELVSNGQTKSFPRAKESEWEVVQEEPASTQQNENFGQALLKAPYRIGEDLYKGAAGFVKNIPEYLNQAKTEVPGLLNPLNALMHPIERSKQGLAGALELGQKINYAPREIAQYAANRLNLIPQEWANKVPAANPINEDIEKYLGSPQRPGDAALRGLVRNVDTAIPFAKLTNALNPLNMTNQSIANQVVRETNRQVNRHTRQYNNLFRRAEREGFNNVPVNQDFINENLNFIKQYKTPLSYRGIENFSAKPTLENAQNATSDLKKITRGLDEKSSKEALTHEEGNLYKAAKQSIEEIENNMFRNNQGIRNERLANRHRAINSSYRENVVPYRYNKNIQDYIDRKITKKQLVNSLSENEFGAKKMGRHPSLLVKNSIPKALTGVGTVGGLGWLLNEMFGNEQKHNER